MSDVKPTAQARPTGFRAILACALALSSTAAHAQPLVDPSAATVLIRVMGNVHLEVTELGATRTIDRVDVETGTGSGFVVSPLGYIATANHVVAQREWTEERGTATVRARVSPTRFEVSFPTSAAGTSAPSLSVDARVVASDPSKDVAVLFVAGTFSYVPLGDSAALERGQPVQVVGYPFGNVVDTLLGVSRAGGATEATISRGLVTALRTDALGELQTIQTDSTINPGNSGGPLLDAEGRAIGVVVAQFKEGDRSTNLGFAVPINIVKGLFETHGLDQTLPGRRLRMGPVEELPFKGMRVRFLEYRNDVSTSRVRVDLGDLDNEVTFRVDRVYTPWAVQDVERWLLTDPTLEPSLAIERAQRSVVDGAGRLRSRAAGRHRTTGAAMELLYKVVDLGAESVVARFVGPAEQVAFNRGVLDAALAAFEADALLSTSSPNVSALTWTSDRYLGGQTPVVTLPSGWLMQLTNGDSCGGLEAPTRTLSVSPIEDFTLSLRAAWWPTGTANAARIADACGGGLSDQAPFVQRTIWAGVSYVTQGIVRAVEGGALVLAVTSPGERFAAARAIFDAWARAMPR